MDVFVIIHFISLAAFLLLNHNHTKYGTSASVHSCSFPLGCDESMAQAGQ